nr:MAG TPA: hypothetical protein [Caudoviricetes sp.]DAW85460.1 MAG TPA: hypothetical protein [Bacteriophage sp.]
MNVLRNNSRKYRVWDLPALYFCALKQIVKPE